MGRALGRTITRIGAALMMALVTPALARSQDYGFDWVTISDPGNRDTLPHEVTRYPEMRIGGVGYEYRMMRTEVTVEQHFEFVQAYWPHMDPYERLRSGFRGLWIFSATGDRDDPRYYMSPGAEDRPSQMSFRIAARFANWLHNGKANEPWAFENGAYDTSTFGADDEGRLTDQERHHPDARVWLPTIDEMAKAAYWDPAKDGGEGGYWLYPHSSSDVPISGLPWDGGETSAGLDDSAPYLDVGSYPSVASPWGLLDGSGGEWEIGEDIDYLRLARTRHGSKQFQDFWSWEDRLDTWTSAVDFSVYGVRFAAAVPSPHTAYAACGLLTFHLTRRRR